MVFRHYEKELSVALCMFLVHYLLKALPTEYWISNIIDLQVIFLVCYKRFSFTAELGSLSKEHKSLCTSNRNSGVCMTHISRSEFVTN